MRHERADLTKIERWDRRILAGAGAAMAAALAVSAGAQESAPPAFEQPDPAGFDRVLMARMDANDDLAALQGRIDDLDDEAREMADAYRRTLAELEASRAYGDQISRLIDDQETEKAAFQDRLDRVGKTRQRVVPLMLDMVDHLSRFIEADIPFLLDERRDRVASLRDALDRADVPTAEKFRAVLEAYQVEAQYGRTLQAYKDVLPGTDRTVELLRVGRIALIYRTLDGRERGYWDSDSQSWTALSGGYRRTLDDAFKIARKQAAPQLLVLPTPAAERARTVSGFPGAQPAAQQGEAE